MTKARLRRPREPGPGECCGSGCTRCVWDVYFDGLAAYEERAKELNLEMSDSDEEEFSSSSCSEKNDEPRNYIGSVVVKYIEGPTSTDADINSSTALSLVLESFLPVQDIFILHSSAHSDPHSVIGQDIQVLNVLLGDVEVSSRPEKATPVLPIPGDVVEVFVPNGHDMMGTGTMKEVEHLCHRLRLNPDQWCELHRSPFVPTDHFPSWLPLQRPMQIRTLFAYFVDISSCSYLLRPTFFQTLSRVSTQNSDAQRSIVAKEGYGTPYILEQCAESHTAPFIYRKIMNGGSPLCYPNLLDVLNTFPFVKLPLARLLEVSGPLRPRKFSVVNYKCDNVHSVKQQKRHLTSVELCLRGVDVWEHNMSNDEGTGPAHALATLLNNATERRRLVNYPLFTGHVSHPLSRFHTQPGSMPMYVSTRLFSTSSFAKELAKAVTSLVKSSPVTSPSALILVGVGTGVAPFMSAVHDLLRCRQDSLTGVTPFNCWVIYGARNLGELVFHQRMKEALRAGAIARYDVSLSRPDPSSLGGTFHPKYVTDVLMSNAEDIRTALLEKGTQLFACGPTAALRSIREQLSRRILSDADDDASMHEQRVMLLEAKKQLMFDIWGTANIFDGCNE